MNLRAPKIDSIRDYFKNKAVLKAYLFGSYSNGEADENSDVDILVELDYSQKIGLLFIQMKLDLEVILKKKVDLVSSNGLSKYMKPILETDKKIIYAR
jgi:predicted nucleotidyltransferase